jgi:hypothetical protein
VLKQRLTADQLRAHHALSRRYPHLLRADTGVEDLVNALLPFGICSYRVSDQDAYFELLLPGEAIPVSGEGATAQSAALNCLAGVLDTLNCWQLDIDFHLHLLLSGRLT